MSTIREMIVRIKANFDNSEFGRAMNNIKQSVNSLPNPNLKAELDNIPAIAAIKKIKDGVNSIHNPEIKANVDSSGAVDSIKKIKSGIDDLSNPELKADINTSEAISGLNKVKNEFKNLNRDLPKIKPEFDLSGFRAGLAQMRASWKETKESMKGAFSREVGSKFASGISTGDAIAGGLGLAAVVKESVTFEDHMMGVAKQVQGARDDAGNLTKEYYAMGDQIKELSTRAPISPNDIADIVTAGARMNVAKEDLMGFTELAIKMGTAFEAPAAEIADQMGKIANVFKIPIAQTGELAGAINYLDDNAISKGNDIIEVLQRTGGAANTVGLSAKNVAALGSTFLSMGKAPEVASTSINSLITTLSTLDPSKIGKAGDDFAKLGLSTKQVKDLFGKDAQAAIELVLTKLGELPKADRILASTNIFGRQFGDDIITVAGNMEEYRRQLQLANSEMAKNSLDNEYQARLKSTSAQLEIFKNKLTVMAVEAGTVAIPALVKFVDAISPIVTAITAFAKENPRLVQTLLSVVAAFVGMKIASLGLLSGVGMLGSGFNFLSGVAKGLISGWWLLGSAFKALIVVVNAARVAFFALAANPIVLAIAAIIAVIGLLIYNWDNVKSVTISVWSSITSTVSAAIENIKAMFMGLFESASKIWAGIKSFFGMGDTKLDINANKNIQMLMANPLGNQSQMLPQAVTNSYYQQQMSQAQSVDNKVIDNRTMTFNIAPNDSATQGKEISRIINEQTRQQNQRSLALAGSGFK